MQILSDDNMDNTFDLVLMTHQNASICMLILLACDLEAKQVYAPYLQFVNNVERSKYAQIRQSTSTNMDSPCVSLYVKCNDKT